MQSPVVLRGWETQIAEVVMVLEALEMPQRVQEVLLKVL